MAKKGFYISKTDTNKKIGPRVLEKGQIWQFCDYVFEAIMLKLKYLLYLKNIHSPLDICLARTDKFRRFNHTLNTIRTQKKVF